MAFVVPKVSSESHLSLSSFMDSKIFSSLDFDREKFRSEEMNCERASPLLLIGLKKSLFSLFCDLLVWDPVGLGKNTFLLLGLIM